MGHFAQECQTDRALRARMSQIWRASRKNVKYLELFAQERFKITGRFAQNGRQNHSLKEERTSARKKQVKNG